jgi:hypothetical protein
MMVELPRKYGPAMTALGSDMQRAFVIAFVTGGSNATAAARSAGYKSNGHPDSLRAMAYHLVHMEEIQAAIQEESKRRMVGLLPAALDAIEQIVENPQHRDQAKVSFGILNRAGLHEIAERNVNVKVTLTHQEKIERIELLAARLGLDPKKLIGNVIDAEYEDVPPDHSNFKKPIVLPGDDPLPTDEEGNPW